MGLKDRIAGKIKGWFINRAINLALKEADVKLPKSWRTSAGGIVTFLYAMFASLSAILDADPATVPDWNLVAVSFTAMLGLLAAKDKQVTGGTIQQ